MTGHNVNHIPMTRLRELLTRPENKPNYKIAERCGIRPDVLSQYALGRRSIKLAHMEALCRELDVSPSELLSLVDKNVV